MADYDLFHKSEIRITNIALDGANLTEIAHCVADTLGFDRGDVMVIDVRDGNLDLDVLRRHVNPDSFVGKKMELLKNLSGIHGVGIYDRTDISSEGMLGWIAFDDEARMRAALSRAEEMKAEVLGNISRRVIVFSSGSEVETGRIADTNTPMIAQRLEADGFKVTRGPTLKDDLELLAGRLRDAIYQGFGSIITTGGVGAEDKDHSVEAILLLDPTAATPYIAKHLPGTGRHQKDGVRIAVGMVDASLLIALPGPNEEVKVCLDYLSSGLKSGASKEILASGIAEILRERLRKKTGIHREI